MQNVCICMQCLHHLIHYSTFLKFSVNLNLRTATLPTPDHVAFICSPRYLLPLANEVWGKVMFSQVSVILSTGGSASRGDLHPGTCIQGGSASMVGVSSSMGVGQTPLSYCGIRSTSGQYTSYWNAFLLLNNLIVIERNFVSLLFGKAFSISKVSAKLDVIVIETINQQRLDRI